MQEPLKLSLAIQNKIVQAVGEKYSTIEGKKHILKVSNIQFDPHPDPADYERQKSTLYNRGTEGVGMFGDLELLSKETGKRISKSNKVKLGTVPTMTNRYSFIINGKEYIANNQLRLRPAIYTKLDRIGTATADFNLAKGKNMELQYQPSKGLFTLAVNKSTVPLYTLLKDVYGTPDKQLVDAFGHDLHAQQVELTSGKQEQHIKQLHTLLFKGISRPVPPTIEGMKNEIKDQLAKTIMDPATNLKTLGKPYASVNPESLVHAASEVLAVYKGTKEPTWKDNLAFKSVHSAEDFVYEKFTKLAPQTINKIRFKLDKTTHPAKVGLRSAFESHIRGFFVDSDIVNYPQQYNPYEFLENAHKITSLGEGGIGDTQSLPLDARNLHPSQVGFIDPVRTPDNMRAGIDLRVSMLTGKEGDNLVSIWKNAKTGKYEKVRHTDAYDKHYAVETEPNQPNGLVRSFYRGKIVEIPRNQMDYWVPTEGMYTVTTGAVPFLANAQGQRTAMAAKMTTQAISLTHREPPLVDTTANKLIRTVFHTKAKEDGEVAKITKTEIHVKNKAGDLVKHFIPNEFPLNYHSYLQGNPLVKVGDKVKAGQILADHNFAQGDRMAIGINANVAYMPYKGYNFEDAVVVTETGAKKFSSLHTFQEDFEIPDDSVIVDATKFKAWFPNKFTVGQVQHLEGAVVKKGTILKAGDPIVLGIKRKRESPEVLLMGKMANRISNPFADISRVWDKPYPGEVIEVIRQPAYIKVVIKAEAPLQLGDKLCFDELTEILTPTGWVPVAQVTTSTPVYQVNLEKNFAFEEVKPSATHMYPDGARMCKVETSNLDIFVSEDHTLIEGIQPRRVAAKDLVGKEGLVFWQKLPNYNYPENDGIPAAFSHEVAVVEDAGYYDKPVYCLTVPSGVLYARRNGKPVIIGNSGRHGNKGIVGLIIPDHEAPRDETGLIPDVLLNPAGLNSRMNMSQIHETVTGKALKALGGKPLDYKNLQEGNTWQQVKDLATKAGITTENTYTDPLTGKKIPKVLNGVQYIYKLMKQTETNFAARAGGEYDVDMRPVKGGEEGAKSVGNLDMYGILGYGNTKNFLREVATYKAEYNPELWSAILSGRPLPPPKPTFTWNKVTTFLNGMGVNVKKEGNSLKLLPTTDKEVLAQSHGEIASPMMIKDKPDPVTGLSFRPENEGLFDQGKTGGLAGGFWTHLKLAKPVVNSLYEKPIRALLDLDQKTYKGVASGEMHLEVGGKKLRGGEAFKAALAQIDVHKDLVKFQQELGTARTLDKKDKLIKKIKYLDAMKKMNLHPKDAYINSVLPIIPPKFRPIYPDEKGKLVVTDANKLYADVLNFNEQLNHPLTQALGDHDPHTIELFKGLHESVQKLQGLDPTANDVQAAKNREASGFLKVLVGTQPKMGFFQSKLLGRVQDLVGRATVAPNPKLGIDEIGIPRPMAWKLYGNFVVGELVKSGYTLPKAKEELERQSPVATQFLHKEMQQRPIAINRAPTLHKHSFAAFKPQIVDGKTLHVCPLIVKGFGMDFDGDSAWTFTWIRYKQEISAKNTIDTGVNFRYNTWHKENEEDLSSTECSLEDKKTAPDLEPKGVLMSLSQKGHSVTREGIVFLGDFPRIEESRTEKNGVIWYKVPEEVETLCVSPTGEIGWAHPEFFTVHPTNKMQKLSFASHRTLYVTQEHSVTTLDADLNVVKALPTKGLLVPRVTRPVFEASKHTFSLPDASRRVGLKHQFKREVACNYDTGYLLGSIAGDGWASPARDQTYVCWACTTPAMEKQWKETIQREIVTSGEVHFGFVPNQHMFDGYDSYSAKQTWSAAGPFGDILIELVGKGAQNKHFPEWFLTTPASFRMGLLAGLIDTDGTINVNNRKDKKAQVNGQISSTSKELAYGTVSLLNSLGLSAGVTHNTTPKGKPNYVVYLSTAALISLKGSLKLFHPEKAANLQKVDDDSMITREIYAAPLPFEKLEELKKLVGSPKKSAEPGNYSPEVLAERAERRGLYSSLHDLVTGRRREFKGLISQYLAEKAIALPLEAWTKDPFWVKWKAWVENKGIEWDLISDMEPAPHLTEAYDLSIPPHFTMVSESGLVMWDTATVHVPIGKDAIADTWNMLPSKNLFHVLDKSLWHVPQQETVMGLAAITTPNQETPVRTFKTHEEAKQAYLNKEIAIADKIKIQS